MNQCLNKKQAIAVEKINSFINQNIHPIFYLLGYAGTGKTFLIGHVIKNFLIQNKITHIYICAPTHQALNVIESSLRSGLACNLDNNTAAVDLLSKISFMTIHKLLEFRPVIMTENGSKIFKSVRESKFLKQIESKLIVIDECSMIPKEMVTALQKYIELYPIKIIFMGDRKQLPPIGEPESLIFTNIPKRYEHQILLDEIMRTKSADIKDVCQIIRNWNQTDDLIKLLLPIHNQKSQNKSFRMYHKKANYLESKWFKYIIRKIDLGEIPIILTWKNDTVDFYNMVIRKYMHKTTNLNTFVVGDYVIFNNFYATLDGDFFYTSNLVKILEIEVLERILFDWDSLLVSMPKSTADKCFNTLVKKIASQKNKFRINVFTVSRIQTDMPQNIQKKTYLVQTIDRGDLKQYDAMIDSVRQHIEFFYNQYHLEKITAKLWQIFHSKLIDPYAQIKFGYSTTIYKAQGSSLSTVLIDIDDVYAYKDPNEFQLALYTAASRASSELGFIV